MNKGTTDFLDYITKFYGSIKNAYMDKQLINELDHLVPPLKKTFGQFKERFQVLEKIDETKATDQDKFKIAFQTVELIDRIDNSLITIKNLLSDGSIFNRSHIKSSITQSQQDEIYNQALTILNTLEMQRPNVTEVFDLAYSKVKDIEMTPDNLQYTADLYTKYPSEELYAAIVKRYIRATGMDKIFIKHQINWLQPTFYEMKLSAVNQPIPLQFGYIFHRPVDFNNLMKKKEYNLIVLRYLSPNPVEFNTIPNLERGPRFQNINKGINKQFLKQTQPIVTRPPAKTVGFTVQVIDNGKQHWRIVKTRDNVHFYMGDRRVTSRMINSINNGHLRYYLEDEENAVQTIQLTNEWYERTILDNIPLKRRLPIEQLVSEVKSHLDLPKIKQTIANALSKQTSDLGRHFCIEMEKVCASQNIFHNTKFPPSEFYVTFFQELHALEGQFIKLNAELKDIPKVLDIIMPEKNNIFRNILYKEYLYDQATHVAS